MQKFILYNVCFTIFQYFGDSVVALIILLIMEVYEAETLS
jgi:hypothetical protein